MVQSWVRMWLVRTRFRRTTAAGRKAAARAARQARIVAAAIVIQKNVRRHLACKKVNCFVLHSVYLIHHVQQCRHLLFNSFAKTQPFDYLICHERRGRLTSDVAVSNAGSTSLLYACSICLTPLFGITVWHYCLALVFATPS